MSLTITKAIHPAPLPCKGRGTVTLTLTGAPALSGTPTDLVLVPQCPGDKRDKTDSHLFVNDALNSMVNALTDRTGGLHNRSLGGGSRMALVRLGELVKISTPLSAEVCALKREMLADCGTVDLDRSLLEARKLLEASTAQRKYLILYLDTALPVDSTAPAALEALKEAGVEVFAVGFGLGFEAARTLVSAPVSGHLSGTLDVSGGYPVKDSFDRLTLLLSGGGGADLRLTETIGPDFRLLPNASATVGTVSSPSPSTLLWAVGDLGLTQTETQTLTFEVEYLGTTGGTREVSATTDCTTNLGESVVLPVLTVSTEPCGGDDPGGGGEPSTGGTFVPEPCPEPFTFRIQGCEDAVRVEVPAVDLSSLGRLVQMDVTLRSLCPDKRVAVTALLTEVDAQGTEHSRGVKHILIPPRSGTACSDVTLRCLRFSVPEALDVSGGSPVSLCDPRTFRARVIANYVDTDLVCC